MKASVKKKKTFTSDIERVAILYKLCKIRQCSQFAQTPKIFFQANNWKSLLFLLIKACPIRIAAKPNFFFKALVSLIEAGYSAISVDKKKTDKKYHRFFTTHTFFFCTVFPPHERVFLHNLFCPYYRCLSFPHTILHTAKYPVLEQHVTHFSFPSESTDSEDWKHFSRPNTQALQK